MLSSSPTPDALRKGATASKCDKEWQSAITTKLSSFQPKFTVAWDACHSKPKEVGAKQQKAVEEHCSMLARQ